MSAPHWKITNRAMLVLLLPGMVLSGVLHWDLRRVLSDFRWYWRNS